MQLNQPTVSDVSVLGGTERNVTVYRFKPGYAVFFLSMHLAAISLAYPLWSAKAFWTAFVLYWITGCFGISICYHRFLTHRSFTMPKWVEYPLAMFGVFSLQGDPTKWTGTHGRHHQKPDSDLDPHSSKRGFVWCHILWMFYDTQEGYRRFAPAEMRMSRYYRFLERWYWYISLNVLLALALLWWGGWGVMVYGVIIRTVVVWHCTFLVNSLTHFMGYKNHDNRDQSRNNWLVALVSFGEGWHENHHYSPRSARFRYRWWELDVGWMFIRLMQDLGLIRSVRKS